VGNNNTNIHRQDDTTTDNPNTTTDDDEAVVETLACILCAIDASDGRVMSPCQEIQPTIKNTV
jgi:hypothetical protein